MAAADKHGAGRRGIATDWVYEFDCAFRGCFLLHPLRMRSRRSSTVKRLIALVSGSLIPAAPGFAQRSQSGVVPNDLSCATCRIVARRVTTLGSADSVGYIRSGIHTVTVDSHGRFWVLSGEGPPVVFDSSGKFVSEIGWLGRGPGEFIRPISAIPISGDSVLIIDGSLRRATVVAGNLAPGRTVQLPEIFRPLIALDWPNIVIGNGTIGVANSIGWPLHRLSFGANEAVVLSSFGPDSGEVRPFEGPTLHQQLSRSSKAGFWSADVLKYRVSRWSAAGERMATLERRPRWFPTASRFWIGNPETPPPPAIGAVADEEGLLWVFIRVAAPTWREVWPKAAENEYEYNKLELEKMFHTMVEVIDPDAKRVVARASLPYWLIEALPGHRAAAYTVDSHGVPHIDVYKLEVVRKN
jgi:hypothetical protein